MKKSEMFSQILEKVCEVCEVSKESVLNGVKLQAVNDARSLCVQYAHRIGLSYDEIALIVIRLIANDWELLPPAEMIKKKAKHISKMFDSYSTRCLESHAFRLMSKDVCIWCAETFEN